MQKLARTIGWRRLLLVAGAAALLGVIVSATSADEQKFSAWSAAVNVGPVVNSTSYDACPTISKSGLSLFFRSNRPGGQGGFDIWVSQRDSLEDPWETPINLGPTINGPANEYCSTFSVDGHWMVFVSDRPGCGGQDLWISHRHNKRDDFGWEPPTNLGCIVNSEGAENGPALFEVSEREDDRARDERRDEATGQTLLYFSSNRPGGLGLMDIYVSAAVSEENDASFRESSGQRGHDSEGDDNGPGKDHRQQRLLRPPTFGPPSLVAELSTSYIDYQPVLRKDGLEVIFASNRPGGFGLADLWASTRDSTLLPWSLPENLGSLVNSAAYDFHPTLSRDGTTLYFPSERPGGLGGADLYVCTRTKLRDCR